MTKNNHFKNFLKKIYYKYFKARENLPIIKSKNTNKKRKIFNIIGGDLNKDKIFYIIQRYPGLGLFSNLTFVVNHIRIAENMGFIPIVDMQNYPTIYNEKEKILNTFNSWEYYFEQVSKYSLEEVYSSKNVIITDNTFYSNIDFDYNITDKSELVEIFKKYIKLNKFKTKTINYLRHKLFKNKKILGVHFRGTGYKYFRNPYPLTINQMINKINEILKNEDYEKIFVMTEDKKNFDALIDYYGSKIIHLETSLRGKNTYEVYDKYPRSRHRYKIGRNVVFETYLLSYCDGFFDIETNPATIVHALNLNPNQKRYTFNNGFNNSWPIFNQFKYTWHIKSFLPESLGGFKHNKKPIKKNKKKPI
tara:strand:+ start:3970 stop:5055 length:1086 start_codon:yes stop_codon:yes gene_type:complete